MSSVTVYNNQNQPIIGQPLKTDNQLCDHWQMPYASIFSSNLNAVISSKKNLSNDWASLETDVTFIAPV